MKALFSCCLVDCVVNACTEYVFKVNLSLDGQKLGEISKANNANCPSGKHFTFPSCLLASCRDISSQQNVPFTAMKMHGTFESLDHVQRES